MGVSFSETDLLDRIVQLDSRFIGFDDAGRYVLADLDDEGELDCQLTLSPAEYAAWADVTDEERCYVLIDLAAERAAAGEMHLAEMLPVLSWVREFVSEQQAAMRRVVGMWLSSRDEGSES